MFGETRGVGYLENIDVTKRSPAQRWNEQPLGSKYANSKQLGSVSGTILVPKRSKEPVNVMTEVQCTNFHQFSWILTDVCRWSTASRLIQTLRYIKFWRGCSRNVLCWRVLCLCFLRLLPSGGCVLRYVASLTALSTCQNIGQASPLIRLKTPRLQSGYPRAFTWKLSSWMSVKLRPSSFIKHQVPRELGRLLDSTWFNRTTTVYCKDSLMIHVDFLSMTLSRAHQNASLGGEILRRGVVWLNQCE